MHTATTKVENSAQVSSC